MRQQNKYMHYNSTDIMAFDFVRLGELKCNLRNQNMKFLRE
jgi:hypothetical protein